MKRARPFFLLTALMAVFSVTCTDEPQPTQPSDELEPSMARIVPPEDEVTELIRALYPPPGLLTSALNRWANIHMIRDISLSAAQDQARSMISDALILLEEGQLVDPPEDSESLGVYTASDGVRLLAFYLYSFTDLEGVPPSDPDFQESPDKVLEWIDLTEAGEVTTENGWAKFSWDGPVGDETRVLASIQLLTNEACDPTNPKSALGCWDFDIIGTENTDFTRTVEICVADPGLDVLTDQEYYVDLRVHEQEEDETTGTPLPYVNSDLDCSGFSGVFELEQTAGTDGPESILASIGSRISDFLLPDPLAAFFREDRRPARGIGGLAGSFTYFYGAPEEGSSYSDLPTDPPEEFVSLWQMVEPQSPVNLCNDPGGLNCPGGTVTEVDISAEAVTTGGTEPWEAVYFYYKPNGSPEPIRFLGSVDAPTDEHPDSDGTHWIWEMTVAGQNLPLAGHIDVFAVGVPDPLVSDDIFATSLNSSITVSGFVDGYDDFIVGTGPDPSISTWEVVAPAAETYLCNRPGGIDCPGISVPFVTVSAMVVGETSLTEPPWTTVSFYFKPGGSNEPLTFMGSTSSVIIEDNGVNRFYTWTVTLVGEDVPDLGEIDLFAVGVNGTDIFATGLNLHVTVVSELALPFDLMWESGGSSVYENDIYVLPAFTDVPLNLTPGTPGMAGGANWSPTGDRILFSADWGNAMGQTDLWIMGADGSDPTALLVDPAPDRSPDLSSESGAVVFVREDGSDSEIMLLESGSSVPEPLTDNSFDDLSPAWSPDGTWIAFATDRDQPGYHEIYLMDSDGGQLTRLTHQLEGHDFGPAWSPDGSRIAYTSEDRDDHVWDIWVMDADGSNPEPFTNDAIVDYHASWSPDGEWIAFQRYVRPENCPDIFVMRSDGSELTQVTDGPLCHRSPEWRPGEAVAIDEVAVDWTDLALPGVSGYLNLDLSNYTGAAVGTGDLPPATADYVSFETYLWQKQGEIYVSRPAGGYTITCAEAVQGVLPMGACTAHGNYPVGTASDVFLGGTTFLRVEVYHTHGADTPYTRTLLASFQEEVILGTILDNQ